MAENPTPIRRRRRWWVPVAVALVLLAAAVAALPWWLGTPPARRWLLARANRTLAPGGLDVATFRFSWTGPTVMTGFAIRDPERDRVVFAPKAVWDRNLFQVLFDRPNYGTLRLDGAALDIERHADGSVDLYEALRPILGPNVADDWTIVVRRGSFRLRSKELVEPIVARRLDLTIRRPSAPQSLTWDLSLAEPPGGGDSTLKFEGEFNRWVTPDPPKVAMTIQPTNWPLVLDLAGVRASASLVGTTDVRLTSGRWSIGGRMESPSLDLSGPPLRGDHPKLGLVRADWQAQTEPEGGWSISRLNLTSSLGNLKAGSSFDDSDATQIDGSIDLAALASQLPNTLRLREGIAVERGTARLEVEVKSPRSDVQSIGLTAKVSDLIARDGSRLFTLHEPATVAAQLVRAADDFELQRLALSSPGVEVAGRGDPDGGVRFDATIDLDELKKQASSLIDLGDIAGKAVLAGTYQRRGKGYVGSLGGGVKGLRVEGVEAPVESVHVDIKINGTVNESGLPTGWDGGRVALKGEGMALSIQAEPAGEALALSASAEGPIGSGRFDAKGKGTWAGQSLAIDSVEVSAAPKRGEAGKIALAVRGRFDLKTGELTLTPIDDQPGGAIGFTSEGLHLIGLGGEGMRGELAVAGDVSALSRAIAAWTGREPIDLNGRWSSRWTVREGDGLQFAGRLGVRDMSAIDGPIALDVSGTYREASSQVDLTELVLTSPFATLEGSGRVADLEGRGTVDLNGRLSPDWERLNREVVAIEPEARVAGRPGSATLTGSIAAGLEGRIGFELAELDVYGMKLGSTPVRMTWSNDDLDIEPIQTTLNGGRLRIDPDVARDQAGEVVFRLAPGGSLDEAEINDEVSRRVLSFVAPVLAGATEVNGFVSATLDRAEFPIGGDASRKAVVEGQVVFDDVAFAPGMLGRELLRVIGREDAAIRLDEPVHLAIDNGRVHQRGFALPLGNLTRIELNGSVGFDRTLDLVASFPLTPTMVANQPLLANVVSGARIRVPIGGTMAEPKINREAMGEELKDLGKQLLTRGAAVGAAEILFRLTRPKDPNAPPPPTAEERKAERQRKRMERRNRP